MTTALVLRALVDHHDQAEETYGQQISTTTHLAKGTIQPILARLERCGAAESRMEDGTPQVLGRALRRYYQLTPDGVSWARTVLQDLAALGSPAPDAPSSTANTD